MFENYICALDISSSKIAACVAVIKKKRITDLYFETAPAKGIKKGSVINALDLTGSLALVLKKLKAGSDVRIKYVYVTVSGQDILTKHSRSIIPLAERGNKVIALSDIHNVNEQARILGSSLEEEILHVMPSSYTIDSQRNILNPIGLYSHTLEADVLLVCARQSFVQSLVRVVNQAGFEMKDMFFSGLAASKVMFKDELRRGINVHCDIGSDITELLVFEEGAVKDITTLELGGDTLTQQLADAFKIPFDLAEEVKRSYGSIGEYALIPEDKEILVKKNSVYKPIKQKMVAELMTSGAQSLCKTIKDAAVKAAGNGVIRSFVVSGRTFLLEGFIETLEHVAGFPVTLARINHPEIVSALSRDETISEQKNMTYLNALGAIVQALSQEDVLRSSGETKKNVRNPLLLLAHKVKEVYQEYF